MRRAGRAPARGDPPGSDEAGPGPASSFSSDAPDPWWYPGKIEWTAHPNRRISYGGFHGERDEFVDVMVGVLRDAGLFRSSQMPRLDEPAAEAFFDRVFEAFKPVPYHCAFRGQETAAAAHALLRQMRARRHGPIDDIECLATLVAACAGSLGHLGLSDQHLQYTNHALCGLYPGETNVVELYSAHILQHFLTDQTVGLAPRVSDDPATRDAIARLVERLVLDRDPETRNVVARAFYGTVERLRAEAGHPSTNRTRTRSNAIAAGSSRLARYSGDTTGLESSLNDESFEDESLVDGHVSRPPLPPGAALSARDKLAALRAVILCAEASAAAMPVARAEFWGHRELMERARECEARAAFDSNAGVAGTHRGAARRRRAMLRSLRDRHSQRQVDELARTTIPTFEALGAFCDGAFAGAVLRQARANLLAWRERLATAREARVAVERKNRCSLAYIDAVGGFGMIATYAVSRQSVLRDKIQYMKGVGRGLSSDASVQASLSAAVAQYETVRGTMAVFAAVCAGSIIACLALATPHAKRRVPEHVRERFLYLVCLVQISARFFFTHHRFTLNSTVRSVERATGASFAGHLGEESMFRRRPVISDAWARTVHGPVVVPCVASLFYYFGMTRMSPRAHLLFHALAVLVRFEQDESTTRGDDTYLYLTPAHALVVARNWRVWRAVAAFIFVVCAVDWQHARQIFPGALRRRVASALFPGREPSADPRGWETVSRTGRRVGVFSSVLCLKNQDL